jgi:hypothetical protein
MFPTWKRELDALVEETMAFAASVTEKKLVQRLANFRAHQLRMRTEREDYYSQTMARTRAIAAGSPSTKDQ